MGQIGGGVLVVSSDLEILRALSLALNLKGYAVTTAANWTEAVARLGSAPLSVMLHDVKDLSRNEWDRLTNLRGTNPELSMILLSSLESPELDRALDEGLIADYVVKPIRLTELEACLDNVGAGRERAGE